jgi:hypothetical protein
MIMKHENSNSIWINQIKVFSRLEAFMKTINEIFKMFDYLA